MKVSRYRTVTAHFIFEALEIEVVFFPPQHLDNLNDTRTGSNLRHFCVALDVYEAIL